MASGGAGGGRHTILLLQQTPSPHSRTYQDFDSKNKAMEGVLAFFESHLKAANPHKPTLSYGMTEVSAFVDGLHDLSALVLDPASGKYEPHGKDYIKESIHGILKRASR